MNKYIPAVQRLLKPLHRWSPVAWLTAACVGVTLLLLLTIQIAYAACGAGNLSDRCSSNYGLVGNTSTLNVSLSSDAPTAAIVDQAGLLSSGPLLYVDYTALEAQARELLTRNMNFRQDISPYRTTNSFNELVRNFDAHSGFTASYTDTISGTIPLGQRIDLADTELRKARDLYAFLAVYAPEARFRSDTAYTANRCAHPEDPNPTDPVRTGRVLDPVIDWCNFGARLRQSVREAAYLRMIFAQQFMVDALGLHFSAGQLLGGEKFVRTEVAKLDAAYFQFDLAERGLRESLKIPLGSGCLVSDFYTQSEWSLLSRAAAGKEQTQYHIGTRLSYLDINKAEDVPKAQANAQASFRTASLTGYVNLIGTAGMRVASPTNSGCAKGERPDGAIIAEMVATMLDTSNRASEVRAGRNIFGFDVSLTPSRPYHTAFGSTDKGLWEQASEAANLALKIQEQTENAERTFDLNQEKLSSAVIDINNNIDNAIQKEAGCDLQAFLTQPDPDAAWYACVDTMIKETATCDPTQKSFDACMSRTNDGKPAKPDCSNCVVLVSDMRAARQQLRTAWIAVEQAISKTQHITDSISVEELRNKKVKSTIFGAAGANSAYEALIAAANCCQIELGKPPGYTVNPGAFVEAGVRPAQLMTQAAFDVQIEDANSDATVRNLFFAKAEAMQEIESALAEYNAMLTTYNGVVGQTGHDVFESKRQHAYAKSLPANDPAYRMVRDSRRLELAQSLNVAARLAYLAARRAEYEYTARLTSSNFRISDIYKARTSNDILTFLSNLDVAVAALPGAVKDAETNQSDLKLSVAQHLLGLNDRYLQGLGFSGQALQDERIHRFRTWVGRNIQTSVDGKQVLVFDFTTSLEAKALLNQMVQQGYDFYWLHKVGGIGQPKPTSQGLAVNLISTQPGNLAYRQVRVSQSGQVALRSFAGCRFDYRLVPPALMMGLDFPNGQASDLVSGAFRADINGKNGNGVAGFSTPAFLGRPLASDGWQVVIYAGSPDGILPDLDLQQLNDIELKISTTYATRPNNTPPSPAECVRIDF